MNKKINPKCIAPLFAAIILLSGCKTMSNLKLTEEEPIGQNLGNADDKITFAGKNYSSTFFDDFNGSELDNERWEKCPEWQRQDAGGYWKNKCTSVKDGKLIIEAKIENGTPISGAIRSRKKFEQTCGLYKIRFKAEKASGLWYAFWLMSDKVSNIGNGAVDGGEIDIFEILPNDPWQAERKKTYLNSAVHWDGYGKDHKSHGNQYYIDDSFYNKWHEVTFEWTPDYYKAYLDNSEKPFWDSTKEGAKVWGGIVQSRNYMKITAEFGKWGGPIDESALPAHLYVDWVKVYKAE